jgi:hypothetical protein
MVHQLFINGTLFNTFTAIDDAINAFREWAGKGFCVRIAFNTTLSQVDIGNA